MVDCFKRGLIPEIEMRSADSKTDSPEMVKKLFSITGRAIDIENKLAARANLRRGNLNKFYREPQ